jgi:sorting nexin-25
VYQDSSPISTTLSRLTLRDVLINPSSLSYFMEFMDRRNRSLLVQFWLTVESFKNPLESVDSSDEDSSNDHLKSGKQSAATVKEDMTMIYDLYFSTASSSATLSAVSPRHVDTIRSFVLDTSATSSVMERRVRKSVLRAQKEVEEELEHDFEGFERSDLWFRAVGDLEPRSSSRRSGQQSVPGPPPLAHRETAPPVLAPVETAPWKSALSRGGGRSGRPRLRPKFLLPSTQKGETSPTASTPPELFPRTESWESTSLMLGGPYIETTHPRPLPSKLDLLISPTSEDDHDASRLPLFDEPQEPDLQSPVGQEHPSIERMEAIQAALIDIIADDKRRAESPRSAMFPGVGQMPSQNRGDAHDPGKHLEGASRQGMIIDGSGDEDQREVTADDPEDRASGSFELAGPGDLQLSYDIERLGEKISKLRSQDAMLDTLIRKAELTGDAQELRLLNRSKSAMEREMRELTFQKMQYEQQDADNRLIPERTRVSISNSAVSEDDGKSVVRYLVEVQQLAVDGTFASGWVVARRYNEFFNMHQSLKDKYQVVRNLEFPGKRLVTSLSSSFVDTRRISLEKYLQVSVTQRSFRSVMNRVL